MKTFLAVASVLVMLSSGAAETPEGAVREFYAAFADGDAARAVAVLRDGDRTQVLRVETRNEIYLRCIEVRSLRLRLLAREEKTAVVESTAHVVRRSRTGPWTSEEVERRTVSLVHQEGAWRIEAMPLAEEALIDAILRTTKEEEVSALLTAQPELVTSALVRRLVTRVIDLGRAGAGRPDRRLAELAERIAAAIDDRVGLSIAMAASVLALRQAPGVSLREMVARAEEALRIAEETDDPGTIGTVAAVLVVAHLAVDSSSEEAERILRRMLAQRERFVLGHNSALYGNLGLVLFSRGDYAAAYKAFTEGLPLDIAERYDNEAGFKEVHIGRILEAQNDPELALEFFRRGTKRNPTKPFLILGHLGIAQASRALGRREEAKAAAEEAMAIARSTPFKGLIARAYAARAANRLDEGDLAGAEQTLAEAAAYAREAKYQPAEIESLLALGNIYLRGGRLADARRVAEEVLEVTERSAFPHPERYEALVLGARIERAAGDRERALETYRAAIDAIEAARELVAGSERQQRLFFESYHAAYSEVADLLLEEGRVAEALAYAERGKGRVLLDTMHRERKRAEEALAAPDRQQLDALVRALGEANRRMVALRASGSAAPAVLAEAAAAQRRAQTALDHFESDLAARDPRLRATRPGEAVVDPAALEELVTPELAILEFVVAEKATHLLAIARRNGRVAMTHHRIDVDAATLAARVDAFHADLAGGSLRYKRSAAALYELLLAPAAAELAGKRMLCIVPDGVLWRVPFEALAAPDGRFVIERAASFSVPSLGVYRDLVARPGRAEARPALRTVVAFGNPAIEGVRASIEAVHRGTELAPLPDAEREAKEIARLWGPGAAAYIGTEAREAAAKEEMQRARIVHFAAHGLFDDANPMFSQIVLAHDEGSGEDGVLQAWELMRLDLAADLVVLSACDTARGRVGGGEGLIGMSWALFAGGCPTVVAAQWKISSKFTAPLMIEFHRRLSRAGARPFAKASALREAQLSLLRDPATRHPFYWAAFVLVGEP
ncbi:MAG TPA: CHAT domain-containing protein [Thermoanaerobaculia bacterium]|nr:CHAT domain-containing protein [Thermoanaerobaculia bacterium]